MYKSFNMDAMAAVRKVFFNQPFFKLLGVLSILALIKMFIFIQFDLGSEEAQYWVWSKHLQLSYYSKPPLIAYLNWLSTFLFGNNVFGIRINAVMIGFLISIVSYLLAYELFNNLQAAYFAAILTNLFPFLLHSSIIFTTDSLLLLFWLCAMLFFWKAAQTKSWEWWLLFGISVGLGALSKYTIFLIYLPLVLFSLKYHPNLLKDRCFYLSIMISLLFFLPVIYWNIQYNGVGFQHLIHLSGINNPTRSFGEIVSNVLEFGIGQIALVLPFYQYGKVVRKFRQGTITRQEAYLLIPAICSFLFFLIVAVVRHAGAYLNWAMFAYTGLPLLFAHYTISEKREKFNGRISILMAAILLLLIGLSSPANRIVPLGTTNPAIKMIGWSQLASEVDNLKDSLPPGSSFVFSNNYHITSELSFYLEGQPPVYCLTINSRMTQYDLWPGIEQFQHTDKTGIMVTFEKITPEIRKGFMAITKEDSCLIYNQNCHISTFYIYLVKGMKGFPKHHSAF